MPIATRLGRDLARGVSVACVLALVLTAGLWWMLAGSQGTEITAYFTKTVGLYPGSKVRMLGVQVGEVESVTPQPNKVKVTMTVDHGTAVPANSRAIIVLPSLVSDRYVALQRYDGGQKMSSGATIPISRTQPPAEVDQLYSHLNQLAKSLGPKGANSQGALSKLLNVGAANLKGNGKSIHDTISNLADASRTLNGNQQDLFTTVSNLAKFTTMLKNSDSTVRDFNNRLSDVSQFLAGERGKLAQVLADLGPTLDKVKTFVNGSHKALKSNVDNLASVTQVLVDERAKLAEVMDVGPLALDNLTHAYNASSGTLDSRSNLNELANPPILMVCKLIRSTSPPNVPQVLADACNNLQPILSGAVHPPSVADVIVALQHGKLPQYPAPQQGTILNSLTGPSNGGGK